jgi:hypothetical protein
MKYAILGEKKAILRISDTEPQFVGENATVVEVSDEIAATVIAGQTKETRQLYFLIDGLLKTSQEYFESVRQSLPKPPRKQTKLKIMRRLQDLNKWSTFKAILAAAPDIVKDAWDLAAYIDESDPMFQANKDQFLGALGITEAQFSSLFDKD